MTKFFSNIRYFFLVSVLIQLTSCSTNMNVVYFQNAKSLDTEVNIDTFESRFKIGDIVSIHVSTFDMEAASPFNLSTGSSGGEESESGGTGLDYLIGKDGSIDFPVLGKVKLVDLTNEEAKQFLIVKLKDYLKDPIVNIRIKNFRITILGAVNSPGTYTVQGERLTILEAIGLAGDLNIQGKRENILVIRDFSGTKTYTRVDITTKALTKSPVYYLTQNDVIYVEPNKAAIVASNMDARIPLYISLISTVITIATAVVLITNQQ